MDTNAFMGLLIGALVVIFGLAATIVTIIVKPIINLNRSIAELNLNIKGLNEKNSNLESRINKHGEQIDQTLINVEKHDLILKNHDKDITYLKEHSR